MYKRIALILLLILLPVMALAQTQEEWNLSCMVKTSKTTTVYVLGTENEVLETIPANTYVKITGTNGSNVKMIKYMRGGVIKRGKVSADCLVFCTSTVRGSDGYATTVHELDPDHDDILANTPVINVAESLLLQGDKDYSNLTFENPESSDAESAQQTAGRGEKVEAEKPAASTAPVQSASKNSGKTSASTKKNSTEKQEGATEATVQIGLVQLGLYTSIIKYEGREMEVPTAELQFSTDVPEDKRIASIFAPRTGRCYLRAKASSNAKTIDKCPAGIIVQVVSYGKSYCQIVYEGQIGYVQTACLTFLDPSAEILGTTVLTYNGKATGNAQVPIRNDKSNDSASVVKLRSGTEVTVIAKTGKWYEITYEGLHGFVHENFMDAEIK